MDKSTLSNYGWIVIAVLVLSVMIALSTPFGHYVKNATENTVEGLFATEEKALNVMGLSALGGGDGKVQSPSKSEDNETNELVPGLYDENDNLIVSWEDSGIDETCSNAKTKLNDYPNTKKIIMGNSVTSIDGIAFYGCANLTSIIMPDSVTSIGTLAFNNCTSLTSINIPKNVTSIGGMAFSLCKSLTSITIPDSITTINMSTFQGCASLTSINIPSSVTSIGKSVFRDCASLTSITVDKNNPIYDSRENCNAIIETSTNVLIAGCSNTIIPNETTTIGYESFVGNMGLTSITIPNSVTLIDTSAFSNCTNLTNITIPNSVTSIGKYAFLNCAGLETINYTGTISEWENINFVNSNWNNGCTQITVHCTDGDVVIPIYTS